MDNNQIYMECGVHRVRDYFIGNRKTSMRLAKVMRMTGNDAPVRPDFELDILEIFQTGNGRIGMGVRTLEHIEKGKVVATYLGEICFIQPIDRTYVVDYENKFFVDAKRYSNISRWFNHDCKGGNLTLEKASSHQYPTLYFRASKDIEAGTELMYNYGYYLPACECITCLSRTLDISESSDSETDWEGVLPTNLNVSTKKQRKSAAQPKKRTRRADTNSIPIAPPSPCCSLPLPADENALAPPIIEHSLPILLQTTEPAHSPTTSLMLSPTLSSNSSEGEPNQRDRSCSPTPQGSMPAMLADALQLRNVKVSVKRLSPSQLPNPSGQNLGENPNQSNEDHVQEEDNVDGNEDRPHADEFGDPNVETIYIKGDYRTAFPRSRMPSKPVKRFNSFKYKCKPCRFGTDDKLGFEQHKKKFHGAYTKKLLCLVKGCKNFNGFPDVSSFNRHLSSVHNIIPVKKRRKRASSNFQCKYCLLFMASQFTLDRHLQRRLKSNKNICASNKK
ncbi:unnamed protein product [Orchesella dallaii]|uniref:SET domain-containing protein n=1 Tax=Orchesella dallaii TaxID=48710 RepID=A0ABP1RZQ1_9HEXA